MRNIWTIAWREFKQYFGSPVFFTLAGMIFLFLGAIFALQIYQVLQSSSAQALDGQIMLGPLLTLFLFTMPALTMRLLSEESRQGTLEILLTAPVRDIELVVGKFLGAFMFATTLLAATWIYPLFLQAITKPNGIDQGPLVSSYVIFLLLTGALIGIGLIFSAIFSNSMAAFFSALATGLALWVSGSLASYFSYAGGLGGSSPLGTILQYMDFTSHFYNSAYYGTLALQDVVYYLTIIILALFITTRIVESKRWR
jgi:ABC-2 type transport system permease protein